MSRRQRQTIRPSATRLTVLDGAVRSGKTFASLIAWLDFVESTGPEGELLMAAKTERSLKRNILDPIAELLDPDDFRLTIGTGECLLFGRRVYLAGANDERSEGKIRGLTLAGAYGDEVTLWPESFFTMLLSRLSVPGARFIGTTNPDSPAHWLKKNYLDRAGQLDLVRYHFRLEDNPALDPHFVANIRAEYQGLWRRRYIEGEWCIAAGAIYSMYDPARHVSTTIPEITETFGSIDYGIGDSAFVVLLGGLGVDDRLYLLDERVHDSGRSGTRLTDVELARLTRGFLSADRSQIRAEPESMTPPYPAPRWLFVDPSAASFRAQLSREGISNVWPANTSVLDGIRNVSSLFATDRLLIHPRCERLLEELPAYSWDPKAQLRGEDRPLKQHDHANDALRYLVQGTANSWRHWLTRQPDGVD